MELDFTSSSPITGAILVEGNYVCKVTKAEVKTSESTGNHYVEFVLTTSQGTIKHRNMIGAGDNNGFLLGTLEALGFDNLKGKKLNFNFRDACGKQAVIIVTHKQKKWQGSNITQAEVKSIFHIHSDEAESFNPIPLHNKKGSLDEYEDTNSKSSNTSSETFVPENEDDVPF